MARSRPTWWSVIYATGLTWSAATASLADLILRDVAEVLAGGVRRTDHLGRVADDAWPPCWWDAGPDGALAFLHRVEQALARVAAARPEVAALSYGTQSLGMPSPRSGPPAGRGGRAGRTARRAAGQPGHRGGGMSAEPWPTRWWAARCRGRA